MSGSLYSVPTFKKKPKEKKEEKPAPIWKNPNIMVAGSIIIVFIALFFIHRATGSKKIDPTALPSQASKDNFSLNSKYFETGKGKDLAELQERQLAKMGIATASSDVLKKDLRVKDFQEQRRVMAITKYEAIREQADRRARIQREKRQKYERGTASQLREAVLSLETSDQLGIMRLERLLEEKLMSKGADSEDLQALAFAFTQLAETYEKKQMQDKAKEAYLNAFKIMKTQAPAEQGPEWDKAIRNIEQLDARISQ